MNMKTFAGLCVLLALTSGGLGECPADTARRAQKCFTDLASGVATVYDGGSYDGRDLRPSGPGSGSGSGSETAVSSAMPLDYRKIREYCAEDGHMPQFMRCVEELSLQCPDLPPEGALKQLINPQRVRTSVPNLCNNVDKVEAGSECMNREMNKRSQCKERAYDMIKSGMSVTAANNTAMFFVQCRFFSVLAECQRTAVSRMCGDNLGDLHADFLLSFVPNVCMSDTPDDLQQGQGHVGDLQKKDKRISELLHGVGPKGDFKKDDDPEDNGGEKGEGSVDDRMKNEGRISDLQNTKPYPGGGDPVQESNQNEEQISERVRPHKAARPEQTSTRPRDNNVFHQVLRTLPPVTHQRKADDTPLQPASPPKGAVPDVNTIGKEVTSEQSMSNPDKSSTGPSKVSIFSSADTKQHGGLLLFAACLVSSLGPMSII